MSEATKNTRHHRAPNMGHTLPRHKTWATRQGMRSKDGGRRRRTKTRGGERARHTFPNTHASQSSLAAVWVDDMGGSDECQHNHHHHHANTSRTNIYFIQIQPSKVSVPLSPMLPRGPRVQHSTLRHKIVCFMPSPCAGAPTAPCV